jgi:hypothetical protein
MAGDPVSFRFLSMAQTLSPTPLNWQASKGAFAPASQPVSQDPSRP